MIVIILIWMITPSQVGNDNNFYTFSKEKVECSILINGGMFASKGRPVGFNYELLRVFADFNNCIANIDPPAESYDCWKELVKGNYDILVVNINDTVPEYYSDMIFLSVPINNNGVWAVTRDNLKMLNAINFWLAEFQDDKSYKQMIYRYFRSYKIEPYLVPDGEKVSALSPYDAIIKKYSKYIGVDWRLLSSVIYQESRYSMGAESPRNALGLMQIKKGTASRYGIDNLYDPELNVKAGTLHIDYLLKMFHDQGIDSANVIKFALASYNAGEGRIMECRQVADSLGLDPNNWDEVTKAFSKMPNFVGKETIRYVNAILERFENYKQIIN
ncbi:MAG: transglycosylase SLT domain-containing protein [Bacteroidales bacterium]|nr:transglycosylase SLT domain-containing protein [Bacteroidales bacterium]